jgi:S-formylglutathione hydrolase FrmB
VATAVSPAAPPGPSGWEDYQTGELIHHVDSHFRTIASRAGRAIAGASIGGEGAMAYAARHPDLYAAAASFSGVLDLKAMRDADLLDPSDYGDPMRRWWFWSGYDPVQLAANLRSLALYLASGNGKPGPLDPRGSACCGDIEAALRAHLVRMVAALRRAGAGNDRGL